MGMKFSQPRAGPGDGGRIAQPHQSHDAAILVSGQPIPKPPGEENVDSVRRDCAAIDMASVLAVNQTLLRAVAIGHPQLCPAIARFLAYGFRQIVVWLAGRTRGEN